MQAQQALTDADARIAALSGRVDAAEQAQAHAQASAAHAQQAANAAQRQADQRAQDMHALTAELQLSRSTRHEAELRVEKLQQDLDASERHRCELTQLCRPAAVSA